MHGSRDEHPAVFTARMQMHKDNKRQQRARDERTARKSEKDTKPDRSEKRPLPLQRKTDTTPNKPGC